LRGFQCAPGAVEPAPAQLSRVSLCNPSLRHGPTGPHAPSSSFPLGWVCSPFETANVNVEKGGQRATLYHTTAFSPINRPSNGVYDSITAKIVAALEDGVGPWVRPWNAEHTAGRVTPLRHNGQALHRHQHSVVVGVDPRAGLRRTDLDDLPPGRRTCRHIRKGEKGSPVVYWNSLTRTGTDTDRGIDVAREVHFLKDYRVPRRTDRRIAGAVRGAGVTAHRRVRSYRRCERLFGATGATLTDDVKRALYGLRLTAS